MKKTKFRRLAAMAASLLCCLIFTVPAYAQSMTADIFIRSLSSFIRFEFIILAV